MINLSKVLSHPTLLKLDQELETVFANAPHLPAKAIEVLVKITPYLSLVSGLFMVTGGLQSIFGANDFYRLMDLWRDIPPFYFYLMGLLELLAGVLSIMAYKPLKAKMIDGWRILFALTFLNLLMSLINIGFFRSGLFGLLLGLIINLYLIYEVKPAYLPEKTKKEKVLKSKK